MVMLVTNFYQHMTHLIWALNIYSTTVLIMVKYISQISPTLDHPIQHWPCVTQRIFRRIFLLNFASIWDYLTFPYWHKYDCNTFSYCHIWVQRFLSIFTGDIYMYLGCCAHLSVFKMFALLYVSIVKRVENHTEFEITSKHDYRFRNITFNLATLLARVSW